MPSKRLAFGCVVLGFVMATGAPAQVPSPEIGPVEKRAKPITPENPIPRRIHSVDPIYPPEAAAIGASGRVTVRAVLDEFGRVAEVRRTTLPLLGHSPSAGADSTAVKMATEAVLRAAAEAVRQWQYDPPADGPIAFNVSFSFTPGASSGTFISQTMSPSFDAAPAPPPPPPPPAPSWAPPGTVRIGGEIRAPQQLRRVNPMYPPEAQAARVQGVVIMEALIGTDGRITDARVLRSIPLLDQAALDAVRQWEYMPTLLNGVPVPVLMTVTVQFTLS